MYAASIVLLLLLVTAASAQTLHDGYAPNPNAEVLTLAVQPDGKLIVGGKFTNVAGQTRHSLTRLLIDGTIDPSFAPVAGTPDSHSNRGGMPPSPGLRQ